MRAVSLGITPRSEMNPVTMFAVGAFEDSPIVVISSVSFGSPLLDTDQSG